jgi:hypothetical protein
VGKSGARGAAPGRPFRLRKGRGPMQPPCHLAPRLARPYPAFSALDRASPPGYYLGVKNGVAQMNPTAPAPAPLAHEDSLLDAAYAAGQVAGIGHAATTAPRLTAEQTIALARATLAHYEHVTRRRETRLPAVGAYRTMLRAGIPARQAARAARALADSYRGVATIAPTAPTAPGFIPRPVAPAPTMTPQQAAATWDSRQASRYRITHVAPNPKKAGTQARLDYDCWAGCTSLADYLNHPAMQRPTKRGTSSAHAEFCINYDLAKGFVKVAFE